MQQISFAILASLVALAPQVQGSCRANGVFDTYCLGAVCLGSWKSDAFANLAQQQYQQICKDGLVQCPGDGPCGDNLGDAARCCMEEDFNLCFACFRDEVCHKAEPSIAFSLLPFQDPTGPVIIPSASCTFGQMGGQVAMTSSSAMDTISTMSSSANPTDASSTMSQPAVAPTDSSSPTAQPGVEPTTSGPNEDSGSAQSQSQATSTAGAVGIMADRPQATAVGIVLAALGFGVL